jgi:glycogen debranching enzyme
VTSAKAPIVPCSVDGKALEACSCAFARHRSLCVPYRLCCPPRIRFVVGNCAARTRKRLIDRLFKPDLWSRCGLRTLSTREKRYNPLSYHNGSVWPHDTALFVAGLKRYGAHTQFNRVREALTALANVSTDKRLPELVGGYAREGDVPPLPYIDSCRPQAWSATALIYVLHS